MRFCSAVLCISRAAAAEAGAVTLLLEHAQQQSMRLGHQSLLTAAEGVSLPLAVAWLQQRCRRDLLSWERGRTRFTEHRTKNQFRTELVEASTTVDRHCQSHMSQLSHVWCDEGLLHSSLIIRGPEFHKTQIFKTVFHI